MAYQTIDWADAVADYILDVRASHKEKTVMFYTAQLRLLSRWAEENDVRLTDFRAKHLRLYLADRNVSDATRRHDAICAKALFKFCYQEQLIESNPLRDYQIPKASVPYRRMPKDDEIRAILAAIPERWDPKNKKARPAPPRVRRFYVTRNTAIITGLLETACRAGEILGLLIDDYQPDRKQIQIRESKGKEPRAVPISADWIAIVDAWLKVRPKGAKGDRLFVDAYGDPVGVMTFSKQFKGYCRAAGVSDEICLHSLRHYALTQIAKKDIWAASQIAGHKDLKVTRTYLHGDADHVRKAHADAAPLGRLLVNKRSERQAKRKRLI